MHLLIIKRYADKQRSYQEIRDLFNVISNAHRIISPFIEIL